MKMYLREIPTLGGGVKTGFFFVRGRSTNSVEGRQNGIWGQ
jgi:hypothetical protein